MQVSALRCRASLESNKGGERVGLVVMLGSGDNNVFPSTTSCRLASIEVWVFRVSAAIIARYVFGEPAWRSFNGPKFSSAFICS